MSEPDHRELFELASRIDEVCGRFESAWQAGEEPRIEYYLSDVIESERADLLRDLLGIEIELRTKVGQLSDEASYCRRFPQYVDTIRGVFADSSSHSFFGQLRDYELQQKLGEGSMGVVYKALHTRLKRPVAIKTLPPSSMHRAETVSRFHREMEAIGQLDDPHIVRAHDAGEVDGTHYLVMEYVDGLDLRELQERVGLLSIPDACEIVRQAALGLQSAAKAGLVHRDLKPSNLMLTRSGTVKILDLGLAHISNKSDPSAELTSTGQVMGTFDYLAPEQATDTKNIDVRADIYSLGCTLFKLLTGRVPFASDQPRTSYQRIQAHLVEPIPLITRFRSEIPRGLETLLTRMLAKQPTKRIQSPEELEQQLANLSAGHDLPALITAAATSTNAEVDTVSASGAAQGTENYLKPVAIDTSVEQFNYKKRLPKLVAKNRAGGSSSIRHRSVRIWLVAVATLLASGLGVIVFVQTQLGILEITTVDETVRVIVSRDGSNVKVLDLVNGNLVKIWSGKYHLKIEGREDLKFEEDTFILERGEKVIASIVWKEVVPKRMSQASVSLDEANWRLVAGVSYAKLEDWLDSLRSTNFRIIHLHGHYHLGTPQFAGIAVKSPHVPEWQVHHNKSLTSNQSDFDVMAGEFHLAGSCGFSDGSNYESLSVWEKREMPSSYRLRSGLRDEDFRREFQINDSKLFDPVEITAFPWHGSFAFTARFEQKMGESFTQHLLTRSQFEELVETKAFEQGFRPISVFAHPAGNDSLFGIVMRRDARHLEFGIWLHESLDTFRQKAVELMLKRGFRPDRLIAYSEGDKCRYLATYVQDPTPSILAKSGHMPNELMPLDAVVEEFMVKRSIPAGTLAVMKDGNLLAARGYGYLDQLRTKPTSPDTPFRLASLSSAFTRAAAAKLISQQKLSLDTKVLPFLGIENAIDERSNEITVEHLLSDRGGWDEDQINPIYETHAIAQQKSMTLPLSTRDIIDYMTTQPLAFRPGTSEKYANYGYLLLGQVIEKASGKPFAQFLKDECLNAIGAPTIQQGRTLIRHRAMNEPFYSDPLFGYNAVDTSDSKWVSKPDGTFSLEAATAAIGLIGSAPDVARFLLHDNYADGKPVEQSPLQPPRMAHFMSGTLSSFHTRSDGLIVVALFNQSHDSSGLRYTTLADSLERASAAIKVWPEAE